MFQEYKSIDGSWGLGGEEGGDCSADSSHSSKIEKAWLFRIWSKFDVKFMKPFLTNSRPTLLDTTPLCCAPLARLLTTTEQLTQVPAPGPVDDMELANTVLTHRTEIPSMMTCL
ncbi:sodium/hydrogen exchanger 9-like isoform X2 [Cherax quadricarinatus]|uniref:sodium/hydrogen exchanger 9-like isoform X2 n=1 Tax=Cherax quadricarinatus TaxID=27406 RepID=UPI00387E7E9E